MFKPSSMTRALCCAIALIACTSNASAETRSVSISSDITDFGWRLIDLNPNDGILPELTITHQYVSSASRYDEGADPLGANLQDRIGDYGATGVNGRYGSASSDLSPTASRLTASLTSETGKFARAGGNSFTTLHFSLTPYTAVIFNAAASVTPSTPDTPATTAYAQAWLNGSLESGGRFLGEFADSFLLQSEAEGLGFRQYYLTGYLHTNGEAGTGEIDLTSFVGATLDGPTAPVPEPETWAMLLAGLGLVGWTARRRKTG